MEPIYVKLENAAEATENIAIIVFIYICTHDFSYARVPVSVTHPAQRLAHVRMKTC